MCLISNWAKPALSNISHCNFSNRKFFFKQGGFWNKNWNEHWPRYSVKYCYQYWHWEQNHIKIKNGEPILESISISTLMLISKLIQTAIKYWWGQYPFIFQKKWVLTKKLYEELKVRRICKGELRWSLRCYIKGLCAWY